MVLVFILILCFGTTLNQQNIENIEKQIKQIEQIKEKIIKIELFLDRATQNEPIKKLEHEPIKKLFDFLKNNSLLLQHPNQEKKTYSFSELTFILNEHALIAYIRKTATKKEELEKMLVDSFGEIARKEITFFIDILFLKIKTLQEEEAKKKLAKTEKKQIATIKKSAQIKIEQERQERINNLISRLKEKNLFLIEPTSRNKIYHANEFLLFLNKPALIAYVNKDQIKKEELEKMFIDAFGQSAISEITLFLTDIFIKAVEEKKTREEREKKKLSLKTTTELEKKNINEEIKNIMKDPEEKSAIKETKLKNELTKQRKNLDERLSERKEKAKEKNKKNMKANLH